MIGITAAGHIFRYDYSMRISRFIPLLLISTVPSCAAEWHENYEAGKSSCDAGNYPVCAVKMSAAIAQKPDSDPQAQVRAMYFINYTPYYYLGAASLAKGEAGEAMRWFDKEANYGVIYKSPLAGAFHLLHDLAERAAGKSAAPQPVDLTATRLPSIQFAPADDCAAAARQQPPPTDWYTYYQAGTRACEAGDFSNCVKNMRMATMIKPREEKSARSYGMNFMDYSPYYYWGWALYELGHPADARQCLAVEAEQAAIHRTLNAMPYRSLAATLGVAAEPVVAPTAHSN